MRSVFSAAAAPFSFRPPHGPHPFIIRLPYRSSIITTVEDDDDVPFAPRSPPRPLFAFIPVTKQSVAVVYYGIVVQCTALIQFITDDNPALTHAHTGDDIYT